MLDQCRFRLDFFSQIVYIFLLSPHQSNFLTLENGSFKDQLHKFQQRLEISMGDYYTKQAGDKTVLAQDLSKPFSLGFPPLLQALKPIPATYPTEASTILQTFTVQILQCRYYSSDSYKVIFCGYGYFMALRFFVVMDISEF